MKKIVLFSTLALPCIVIASEAAHHNPSIKDLIWPAVNFTLLFGVLTWKLKAPLNKMFKRNAELVEEVYLKAEMNSNDAIARIEEVQKKMESFIEVKNEINKTLEKEFIDYTTKIEQSTSEQIAKMKSDNTQKIENERIQLTQELNIEIVDQVIELTKNTITENKNLRESVTEKILMGLQ